MGTDKADELVGTSGRDVIVGLGRDDSIVGRGGHDLICGGDGFDVIRGGGGNDRMMGGTDADSLYGGPGNDRAWGGRGMLDALFGGAGADRLGGGPGSFDGLIGGVGDDVMNGGRGLDLAYFFDSPNPIEADLETDTAIGYGSDRILAIEGIVGSNFGSVLRGDEEPNALRGGDGDDLIEARGSGPLGAADFLDGGGGNDVLDGGEGFDILTFEDSPTPIVADLSQGTAEGWGSDSLESIEGLLGSLNDDTLLGDHGDNAFEGWAGDDMIDGGPGSDVRSFAESREPVTVNLGEESASAGAWGDDTLLNIENLWGSSFGDVMAGDDEANVIRGGSGKDAIQGLAADDVLVGDAGIDNLNGGHGTDECDGEVEVECELDPPPNGALIHLLSHWMIRSWTAQ